MGFLKDLSTLTRQANERRDRFDVGASLAAAQASIDQANRMMAASVPQATDASLEPLRMRTTATVVGARQLPMMVGMNAMVELDVHVLMPGGVPLPVTRTEQVAPLQLAAVQPGAQLPASIVPGHPETFRIEWAA
ncbi:hypothetical protein ACDF64_01485 [Agromyces sp. MMS24-JH15]|uniref:hypothetical protein n=1 Tax=Agromyces sp. MMS24-JH15 TaxID=3243765 RepID=UPI003748F239